MNTQNSNNKNVQVVKTYFDCLANGDLNTLGSLFAENVIWHQPGAGSLSGVHEGKQAVFALFGKFMEISEGTFRINAVDSIMANGDFVSATLSFSASKKNGSQIKMNGVDVMRIENGKIKEVFLFSADQESEDQFWG
ncbi:MAG: nuclear transport factor 2 family protein [Bdellovibrionaceae bacterium]|nr:nuclear transport factor 2 family protein [Pseudobdellovibrionaceae bacterium]